MQRNIGSSTLRDDGRKNIGTQPYEKTAATVMPYRDRCGKCGAVRQDRQLGLEKTPEEYVAAMVDVFREVRRVLRSDGTCWVNLGDSYATGTATPSKPSANNDVGYWNNADKIGRSRIDGRESGLKPKDLCGIPWRVAFALQADGWYLRSAITLCKVNPMPESVTDRPTSATEMMFLLTKRARYFYDAEAVRERSTGGHDSGVFGRAGNHQPGKAMFSTRVPWVDGGARNLRNWWPVTSEPYPGAHFATFGQKWIEPCVLAGTSERGVCPDCGAPWRRVVERGELVKDDGSTPRFVSPVKRDTSLSAWSRPGGKVETVVPNAHRVATTTGWQPTCAHVDATPAPATVMDPFCGSGTVALVANRLSRRTILVDLSADYLAQSLVRNQQSVVGL